MLLARLRQDGWEDLLRLVEVELSEDLVVDLADRWLLQTTILIQYVGARELDLTF